jgi:CheY-like chemotaxis protein
MHVLLAEDNTVNQRLATRLLEKRGHRVTVANNGQEAIALLGHSSFDLVLMDVQMPLIDGLEATRTIRKQEEDTGIHQPIVALTAHAVKGDQERCEAAGMDGYLAKPIRSEELDAVLQKYMSDLQGEVGVD